VTVWRLFCSRASFSSFQSSGRQLRFNVPVACPQITAYKLLLAQFTDRWPEYTDHGPALFLAVPSCFFWWSFLLRFCNPSKRNFVTAIRSISLSGGHVLMYCNEPGRLARSDPSPRHILISYTSFPPREIGITTHTLNFVNIPSSHPASS